MPGKAIAVVLALAILVASANVASANAQASPESRLLMYLWKYEDWLLRQYVSGVTVTGGQDIAVNGQSRRTGATANVRVTLRDRTTLLQAARHICAIAAAGVQTLHLRTTISTIQVWSDDGHPVARC